MSTPSSKKSTVRRAPKRGIYDREKIYEILDRHYLCHVGFIHHGQPVVIPTMFGRDGDSIYIHGASVSRLMTELEKGVDVSISVASVQGLVLARSAFNHSLNYESVVIFGKGFLVPDKEKDAALKVVSDHLIPERWEEVRLPSPNELKATKVIKIHMTEVSAKVRTGDPIDNKADYDLEVWAGVLPIDKEYGQPISDPVLKEGLAIPPSVLKQLK